jgi:hypothetical protein
LPTKDFSLVDGKTLQQIGARAMARTSSLEQFSCKLTKGRSVMRADAIVLSLGELQSDHTYECRYISLLQYRARTRQQSVWAQTAQARAFFSKMRFLINSIEHPSALLQNRRLARS